MATKQAAAGEALAAQINAMTRSEMYDMMSQMKAMIDHNQETVRRMLVDNPDVTRALFRAQVVLGMVKMPKTAQSTDVAQPTVAPTAPSPVKAAAQDHVSLPQPSLPANPQSVAQHSGSFPSASSNVASSMDLPPMSANPPQSAQAKGYPFHQMPSASAPQSSQNPNMTLPHAPPQYSNIPSHMPVVHSQPQQPLQNPAIFNQQLQPPLPQLPRPPSMQSFAHQMHPQVPNSFGLTHANAPQHILQQQMFHQIGNPQTSFLSGQPPLPNQPPPQLYQASSHYNSQSLTPMQVDRPIPWGQGPEAPAAGSHFPGQLPGLPGQMTQGIGGIQTGQAPLTPEMEKMLVQQVLGMSPEQINMLPPEQRQQVLQLRDMLRQ
ncbi:cleavage stimulating factor 64-like [Phragmites australis]|uniref:cleavage stimulating factor 64-like n=1 Tax=Phragmites australis TaxID=29695 RepID=UPI002D7A0522|nr:cleavage stimulating factor 64-like [Phragmites australis]